MEEKGRIDPKARFQRLVDKELIDADGVPTGGVFASCTCDAGAGDMDCLVHRPPKPKPALWRRALRWIAAIGENSP